MKELLILTSSNLYSDLQDSGEVSSSKLSTRRTEDARRPSGHGEMVGWLPRAPQPTGRAN